jgi:hypothetical protein
MRCKALCDKTCQWFATGQWFSPGTLVSSTNKTDHHDITEILLKVALNTRSLTLTLKIRILKVALKPLLRGTVIWYLIISLHLNSGLSSFH